MDRSLSLLANGVHVSEYLYYEFRAVDRPLTHREIRELRALSTRAEITATSFVNTYNWGDFKGDPDILMEKYFDAFVHTANGCVFQLVLRLPRRALDVKDVSAYCVGESLRVRKTKNFTILEFISEGEGRDWEDSEGWMDSLIPLRADLMRGDLRALYLGWLFCLRRAPREQSLLHGLRLCQKRRKTPSCSGWPRTMILAQGMICCGASISTVCRPCRGPSARILNREPFHKSWLWLNRTLPGGSGAKPSAKPRNRRSRSGREQLRACNTWTNWPDGKHKFGNRLMRSPKRNSQTTTTVPLVVSLICVIWLPDVASRCILTL